MVNMKIPSPRCIIDQSFLSTALPHERWVHPFVNRFIQDLQTAGVTVCESTKYLEKKSIDKKSKLLVLGTPPAPMQTDLITRPNRLSALLYQSLHQKTPLEVFFIALSDQSALIFPNGLLSCGESIEFYDYSYLSNLKKLLLKVYSVTSFSVEYERLWCDFERIHPRYMQALSQRKVLHYTLPRTDYGR